MKNDKEKIAFGDELNQSVRTHKFCVDIEGPPIVSVEQLKITR